MTPISQERLSFLDLLHEGDGSEHLHDAGGRVSFKLKSGMSGSARFSACGQYRPELTRGWAIDGDVRYILWIGCNPSTATARVDDPTIRKEIGFTARFGFQNYAKANVMDYRATKPDALLADGVTPCSEYNLPTILELAKEADIIVAAWGSLLKPLQRYAESTEDALRRDGHVLHCLGTTKHGNPRHPLYVADKTKLEVYRGVVR